MNGSPHRTNVSFTGLTLLVLSAATGAVALGGDESDADMPPDGLLISVIDAASNRPIPEFRVLAGVKSGGVADEFEKRTGQEVVNWQPHTIREGRDGVLFWPLNKAYEVMALRVEAYGFMPANSAWIKKA